MLYYTSYASQSNASNGLYRVGKGKTIYQVRKKNTDAVDNGVGHYHFPLYRNNDIHISQELLEILDFIDNQPPRRPES